MNSSITKRPSDFTLSRYILGECSNEDSLRVKAWLDSSPDAKKEVELFKSTIETEENTSPHVFKKPDSVFTQIRLHPVFQLKTRSVLAFSVAICILLFALISLNICQNGQNDQTLLISTKNNIGATVFRDTLEVILRLTTQNQLTSFSSAPSSDVTGSSLTLNSVTLSNPDVNKADRTMFRPDTEG